jgi:hypothetical protein
MTAGQVLTLLADEDVVITRRLVAVENGLLFVCKDEEFEAAKREKREPTCIGFRPEYLIKPKMVSSRR